MITDKLTIYGDKEKAQLVSALAEKCADALSLEGVKTQVYLHPLSDEITGEIDAECVIVEYKDKEAVPEGVRCVTYSLSDSRADAAALNIQNREHSSCFELLHQVFMSRIFIPHTSEYTPEQVLVCAAVLLSTGASADKIVTTINELLK